MQKRARQLANECASFVDLDCLKDYTIRALDYREGNCEFIRLFQHLDATYREIDTVFEANGLARMTVAPSNVHMREGANGKFLEFFSYKDLPFRLRDTSEVTWEHFRGVEKYLGYGNLYEKAAKDLDQPFTIVEDFTKELYSDTSRADIRVKQVLRRYQESDRDVIVFTYRAVPAQIKHKILSGLTYHLRGYAVTKKSPVSTPGQEQTLLQLCTLVSLDPDGVPFRLDACSFRALTNFLIVHTAQNMQAHRELIENALIDQVTRRLQ
ncbi:M96 mating-specific protein family [Phytophthora cinnamomi]|uniref:M96 mating-specific protein family n=1 Tax=Phytophthora cinnamomi TaxID=4785 RepID=UPI00355AB4EB|nr:M96 mating-specific protein family [Phytophthora cinnamomi]